MTIRSLSSIRALPALALAVGFALAPGAQAQSDASRVLLDARGEAHQIRLISISDEAIIYEDALGRRRQATVGGYIALLPALPADAAPTTLPAGPPAASDQGVLELNDGQRFPGQPAPTVEDDALVWSHPTFGLVSAPIDSIARLALKRPAGAARPEPLDNRIDDQLVLVNGDRLVGFLVSFGDPVEFEVNGETIAIPLDRISEATLANPPSPMSGMVVWLEDGSVAVVASLQTRLDESVSVRLPGGQTALVPLDDVRAVAFDAGRLRPLASLPLTSQRPVGERGVFDPVRTLAAALSPADLNAPDIEFPGPMETHWTLPGGAVRLAGVAELPLEAMPWGDCDLVIAQRGVELMRERLRHDRARIEFSLPVTPGDLRIAIEPGDYGPISDRVVLRRPLVLTE